MNFSRNETAYPSNGNDAGGKNGTFSADTGDELASFLLGSINNGQISTTNFISSTKKALCRILRRHVEGEASSDLDAGASLRAVLAHRRAVREAIQLCLAGFDAVYSGRPELERAAAAELQCAGNDQWDQLPALFPNVIVSRGAVGPYLIPWDKKDFGPRLGFAYNWREKTVIRGFFGIFYGGEENQGGNPNRGESAPFNLVAAVEPAGGYRFLPTRSVVCRWGCHGRGHVWLSVERVQWIPGFLAAVPRGGDGLHQSDGAGVEPFGAASAAGEYGGRGWLSGESSIAPTLTAGSECLSECVHHQFVDHV